MQCLLVGKLPRFTDFILVAGVVFDKRRSYDALNDDTLDAVLARLVARDGLSFHVLAHSKDLKEGIEARQKALKRTVTVPSDATIRNNVMRYAGKVKAIITQVV